jgi:hypothetical protein
VRRDSSQLTAFARASIACAYPKRIQRGCCIFRNSHKWCGDLSFTRASSATRVNSAGLIEEVRTNLLLQYTFSCYYKGIAGETTYMYFLSSSGGTSVSKKITFTGEWQRESITFTAGSASNFTYIVDTRQGTSTATDFEVWGGQLEVSDFGATDYIPTTTTAVSVGMTANVPRLTYQNGGGGCPSLLLEPQRTNLATYSEQFDNASWKRLVL